MLPKLLAAPHPRRAEDMWVVMSDDWGVGRGLDVSGQNLAEVERTIAAAGSDDGVARRLRGTFVGDDNETEVVVTGLSGLRLVSE